MAAVEILFQASAKNKMPCGKSVACGIPLERVGLIVPLAILLFFSCGSASDASSWELIIATSIIIGLAIHPHHASKWTRKLKVASNVPCGNSGDDSCPAAHNSAKPHASVAEDPRMRLIRVLRDTLNIDASAYERPSDVFYNDFEKVTKLLTWMQSMETNPRPAARDEISLFSVLWQRAVRVGDVPLERALTCMVNCGVRGTLRMYTQVISGLGNRGKVEEAEIWFSRVKELGMEGDEHLYSSMIHGWAQSGNPGVAAKWYDSMLKLDLVPTEVTYNSLIHACAKGGNPEDGEKWMHTMQAAGIPPTVSTFNTLINAFTRAGQTERAEYWLMEIIRRGMAPDIVSFSTIIHALAIPKCPIRVMQADRLLRRMIACGLSGTRQDAYNYRCVIMVCARGREWDFVRYWLKAAEEAGVNIGKYSYKFVAKALEMAERWQEAKAMREKVANWRPSPRPRP